MQKSWILIALICGCTSFGTSGKTHLKSPRGTRTVASVIAEIGPHFTPQWRRTFIKKGIPYPPTSLTFVALKKERRLEVWSQSGDQPVLVKQYRILAASGGAGPKLRQGDYQVPEGHYKIHGLNPNSAYHLSLRVNYPNSADRLVARQQKRTRLGGDIFIHGDSVSAGCLAMGDAAIEEIFSLAATVYPQHIPLIIAPYDFRRNTVEPTGLKWLDARYQSIDKSLDQFVSRGSL